jgi:hypothetical protein
MRARFRGNGREEPVAIRLIVDGHNLALSGALPLSFPPSEAEGRRELCALLSAYARRKGITVTVVFDGAPSGHGAAGGGKGTTGGGTPEGEPFKGGRAIYSPPGQSGDDVVRRLASAAPEGSVVVTNDRGLAMSLRGPAVSLRGPAASPRGGRVTVVSCAEFAEILLSDALAERKGAPEEEDEDGRGRRGTAKKGEAKRAKKGERRREDALRKLR